MTDTTAETFQRRPGAPAGNRYALRHGLFAREDVLAGEDHNEYVEFTRHVLKEEGAVGVVEGQLAMRMAGLMWRLERVAQMEMALMDDENFRRTDQEKINRLSVYECRLAREVERTRKLLKAVQAERPSRNVEPVQYGPPPDREETDAAMEAEDRAIARAKRLEKSKKPRPASEIWSTPAGAPEGGKPAVQNGSEGGAAQPGASM